MKKTLSLQLWFALFCGILGCLLNLLLHLYGIDSRGLLSEDHPAGIGLFVLCGVALLGLLLTIQDRGLQPYPALFPASGIAALGCCLGGVGILLSAGQELALHRDPLSFLCAVLAVAAAVSLGIAGRCRFQGRRPSYWLYVLLTLYGMCHLICQYRNWSSEAQLLLYFFPLMASVFLMLTAYHSACLAAGTGSIRWYTFFSLGALFFSCVSLYGINWIFYLAMALWTATAQCTRHVPKFGGKEV